MITRTLRLVLTFTALSGLAACSDSRDTLSQEKKNDAMSYLTELSQPAPVATAY